MIQRTPHQQRIDEFMRKAGQDVPDKPCIPDASTRILRAKLILEEALETVRALGVGVDVCSPYTPGKSVLLTDDDVNLEFKATGEVDVEGVVDGCAGIADQPILEEVDAANLRKFGPGGYRREDGKWIKPADWTPPDIMARLAEQGHRAEV